jgi:predicted nucleotidyltransferase
LQSLVLNKLTLTELLKKSLQSYSDRIHAAFVYGSVAKGTATAQSDIDIMVIGDDLDYCEHYTALQAAESTLRRKISPIFLSPAEWRRRISQEDSFISKISALRKLFIVGSEKDICA